MQTPIALRLIMPLIETLERTQSIQVVAAFYKAAGRTRIILIPMVTRTWTVT